MDRDELLAFLVSYLATEFDIEEARIVPEAQLFDELGLDSIDALDMVAMFEEKVGLALKEDDLKKLITVQNLVDYLIENAAAGLTGLR